MAHRQFIWIMTDTTGWNMVGCYGFEGVITPNIDSLAQALTLLGMSVKGGEEG